LETLACMLDLGWDLEDLRKVCGEIRETELL